MTTRRTRTAQQAERQRTVPGSQPRTVMTDEEVRQITELEQALRPVPPPEPEPITPLENPPTQGYPVASMMETYEQVVADMQRQLGNLPPVLEAAPSSPTTPTKGDIKRVLPANILQLLEAFPNNDTVRTMVSNKLKKQLPPEAVTFVDIRKWVEEVIPAPPPTPPSRPIDMIVTESGVESGTCSYSRNMSGQATFRISDELIKEIWEGEDWDDMDSFLGAVSDHVMENVEIDMEPGDEDISEHSSRDYEGHGKDYGNWTAVKRALVDRVRALFPEANI